jgi:hypothetical protein
MCFLSLTVTGAGITVSGKVELGSCQETHILFLLKVFS